MQTKATVTVNVRITNKLQTPRVLVIEPWLTEYALPSGKTLDVVAQGNPKYPLEMEIEEDRFVLYSFDSAGATVSVFDKGVEAERARSK